MPRITSNETENSNETLRINSNETENSNGTHSINSNEFLSILGNFFAYLLIVRVLLINVIKLIDQNTQLVLSHFS